MLIFLLLLLPGLLEEAQVSLRKHRVMDIRDAVEPFSLSIGLHDGSVAVDHLVQIHPVLLSDLRNDIKAVSLVREDSLEESFTVMLLQTLHEADIFRHQTGIERLEADEDFGHLVAVPLLTSDRLQLVNDDLWLLPFRVMRVSDRTGQHGLRLLRLRPFLLLRLLSLRRRRGYFSNWILGVLVVVQNIGG